MNEVNERRQASLGLVSFFSGRRKPNLDLILHAYRHESAQAPGGSALS